MNRVCTKKIISYSSESNILDSDSCFNIYNYVIKNYIFLRLELSNGLLPQFIASKNK